MIYQQEENRCGEACIRNVIAILSKKKRNGFVQLKNGCSNFLLMAQTLEENGMEGEGYEYKDLSFLKEIKRKQIIFQIKNKQGQDHFILFRKRFFNLYVFFDPASGWKIINSKSLSQIATKYILICYINNKKHIKAPLLTTKADFAVLLMFNLLEASVILFLVFLMKINNPPFLFFLLLVLEAFLIYFHRSYSLMIQKRILTKIGIPYYEGDNSIERKEEAVELATSCTREGMEKSSLVSLFFLTLIYVSFIGFSSFVTFLAILSSFLILLPIFQKEKKKALLKNSSDLKGDDFAQEINQSDAYGKLTLLHLFLLSFFNLLFLYLECIIDASFPIYQMVGEFALVCYVEEEAMKGFDYVLKKEGPYEKLLRMDPQIYLIPSLYGK
jgi:hypothetical protein